MYIKVFQFYFSFLQINIYNNIKNFICKNEKIKKYYISIMQKKTYI
jgi:hypothetical protein